MKRTVFLALVAACGGGGKTSSTASDTLGTSTHATNGGAHHALPEAQPDPTQEARAQFVNPGGMWMPAQMTLPQHVETFKKLGVKLDPATLADPLSPTLASIVSLGGCTASFVSPDGLIVTNHHCVQSSLQFNSSDKENLVKNGFLAKTREDERLASPSQRVMVVQAYKDVTKDMRDGLEEIKDPIARHDEHDKRMKALIAKCEEGRPGIRCNVSRFFGGGLYQLIEYLEVRDVRLVYVPPRSVGNFGGEVDNWNWPRHTGDFSFYRAYVGKDGTPADFSKENVPFHPKSYLRVSDKGLRPNDFVMVAGYPGTTARTDTASEVRHDLEWFYPYAIAYSEERYKIAAAHLNDPGETGIKATTLKQSLQNGLEKYRAIIEGMKRGDLVAQRDELDRKIKAWAAQPGNEKAKASIDKLEQILAEQFRTDRVDTDRERAFAGSKLLSTALSLTYWSVEREKPDIERRPNYQDRDMSRAIGSQKSFAKSFDRTLDRALFRLALVRATQLPEADRTWLATLLDAKKGTKIDEAFIDKTLDAWYKAATLEDEKLRLELLQKGTVKQLKASKDPFVQAAQRIWPIYKAEEKREDSEKGALMLAAPAYIEGMRTVLSGGLPPDANGTLRITYGTVKSRRPESKDQADWPFTTASQIPAKVTGKDPFDAPARLVEAVNAKQYGAYADPALGGELAVDFQSDVDTTGGNSGSPTLNDKGELVGLLFDGTREGLFVDVVFVPGARLAIHVDARYMLWNMDLLDGADHLIKEMGLTPKLQ